MLVSKIVSGGQTGVDRAALDAAILQTFPYGGWLPKGRKAEDGPVSEKYSAMQELPSASYTKRTEQNVIDSDGTLIFMHGRDATGGTLRTIGFCVKHEKPFRVIDLDEHDYDFPPPVWTQCMIEELACEADKDSIVLNVAGPRESKSPGIYEKTRVLLSKTLGFVRMSYDFKERSEYESLRKMPLRILYEDYEMIRKLAIIHNVNLPMMVNDLVNIGRKYYADVLRDTDMKQK